MQLTQYTDYSLRVLIFLGINPGRRCTITEISEAFKINRNHLVKVVHNLSSTDWVKTIRGKSGGMELAMPPDQINIGNVVDYTEPNSTLLECFDVETNTCPILPACALRHALYKAQKAFMDVLASYTLEDILHNRTEISILLGMPKS